MSKKTILLRLLKDVSSNPFWLAIVIFLTIIQVGLAVSLPLLIGDAIDALMLSVNRDIFIVILAKITGVVISHTIVVSVLPIIINKRVLSFTKHLREATLKKLHSLPVSYLDQLAVGDLASRVTTDTEQLGSGLLMFVNQFLTGILMIIVTLFSMVRLDSVMVVLVIGLTPLSLIVARYIAKQTFVFSRNQAKLRGEQSGFITEAIQQSSLIKSFGAEKQFNEKMVALNTEYANQTMKAIFYASTVNPVTRFINALIYAVLTGIGAYRIMSGFFSVGQLVTFLQYVNQYTKPFNDISSVMSELQSSIACAERIYQILDKTEESESILALPSECQGEVIFENVSFRYREDKQLIEKLSLTIPSGSKVAIVGPTGAGKSTLINLLMRFHDIDSGEIYLDGLPITKYSRSSLRQQFGMVLQETWLKEASIHDNIAYANPSASRKEVVDAAKASGADFFINQLPNGYDSVLSTNAENLSEGQRQLLSIARVYLKNPKLLILDEATSSIDTRTELIVQESLERLMTGRTSFIIAHRLSTIRTADIILVMVAGDIVEFGTHDSLMKQQGYYFKMQVSQTT